MTGSSASDRPDGGRWGGVGLLALVAAASLGCFDVIGAGTSYELAVPAADVWSALTKGAGTHDALAPADPSVTDPFHAALSVHASGTLSLGPAATAQVWVYGGRPTVVSLWAEDARVSDALSAAVTNALRNRVTENNRVRAKSAGQRR